MVGRVSSIILREEAGYKDKPSLALHALYCITRLLGLEGSYSEIESGLYAGEGCVRPPNVDAIICLASDCRVLSEDIEEYCFDVEDFSVEPIGEFAKALSKLVELRANGRRVYVHCYAGCGRTGTLVSAYLVIVKGFSAEEAINYYRYRRGCGPQSWDQIELIYALEKLTRKLKGDKALEVLVSSRDFGDFLGKVRELSGNDS